MQDARWLQLQDCLFHRGWTSRDGALCAPHATMSFARIAERANLTAFRDQIYQAAQASAAYVDVDVEHAALHLDLVSLVDALDEVFQN